MIAQYCKEQYSVQERQSLYFLYPLDSRRPRAVSNLRPLDRTKGLTWLPGRPAAPKCFWASRALRGPWISRVPFPVGALRASWAKVMISPRAFSVTRRAHRVILGTSKILRSLVTVPTQTASLLALPSFFRFLTRRARDSGGRLILLMKSLLRMILLNLASVLLAKNL